MAEISDMDQAQHIKMDYAQNFKKDPEMAKKRPSKNSTWCCQPISQFNNIMNLQQFHLI